MRLTKLALATLWACSLSSHSSYLPPDHLVLANSYQQGIDVSEYWKSENLMGFGLYGMDNTFIHAMAIAFTHPSGLRKTCLRSISKESCGQGEASSISFNLPFSTIRRVTQHGAKSISCCLICPAPQEIIKSAITTFCIG